MPDLLFDLVLVFSGLFGGAVFGSLYTHRWYFDHFRSVLKRRVREAGEETGPLEEHLAKKAKKRAEVLDRRAVESDFKLFSKRLMAAIALFFERYWNSF